MPRNATSAVPSSSWLGTPSVAATWAVPDQQKKQGAGVLLFAYGAEETLQHFLFEAGVAAKSFRSASKLDALLGRTVKIAVVTNNATVDGKLFDVHLKPRADLLFVGSRCSGSRKRCAQQGTCHRDNAIVLLWPLGLSLERKQRDTKQA